MCLAVSAAPAQDPVVFLTDVHGKFTYPNGKSEEAQGKAGEPRWGKAGKHLPENTSDNAFELILVELKGKR
jgi:hypothetical protein